MDSENDTASGSGKSNQGSERDRVAQDVVSGSTQEANAAPPLTAEEIIDSARRVQPSMAAAAADLHKRRTELGIFGKLIGGEGVSATHVAFTVILCSFALVLFLFVEGFWRGQLSAVSDSVKVFAGLISSALAFIFGRASKSNSQD